MQGDEHSSATNPIAACVCVCVCVCVCGMVGDSDAYEILVFLICRQYIKHIHTYSLAHDDNGLVARGHLNSIHLLHNVQYSGRVLWGVLLSPAGDVELCHHTGGLIGGCHSNR